MLFQGVELVEFNFFEKKLIIFLQHIMVKSARLKRDKEIEDNIIKHDTTIIDVRNLFRLKREIRDTTIKDIRNILDWKKKIKQLKIE